MGISLKSDFVRNVPEKIVEVSGVGQVVMRDVGMELQTELREFYNRVMRPNYILGHKPLFEWMFKNNGGKVAVLTLGGKVIAHQGHVPIVFCFAGKDYRGFISATTVVDESFRRLGLMTLLRGSVQDRYEMACSIGGSDQGVALYKAMGYMLYGYLRRMIAIVDPANCKGITKEPELLKATVSLAEKPTVEVKKIDDFFSVSDEVDSLINGVFGIHNFFGVKRNAEFFDWRYTQHPIYDYECYGLWKGKKLLALIVFRREEVPQAGTADIRITELIGQPEDINVIVKNTVLTRDKTDQIGWIDFFCANRKISESLASCGFFSPEKIPTDIPIFCNPVDYSKAGYPVMLWSKDESVHARLPALDEWYITKGDGDADRPNQLERGFKD